MNDRTEQTDTAVILRPSCPSWCTGAHLTSSRTDFHHVANVDIVSLPDMLGRDSSNLEVGVSLFHSEDASLTDEYPPMVEIRGLENSGSVDLGLLTAPEARRLAARLVEAADLLEAPLSNDVVLGELHAIRDRMAQLEQLVAGRG